MFTTSKQKTYSSLPYFKKSQEGTVTPEVSVIPSKWELYVRKSWKALEGKKTNSDFC